MIRFFLLSVLVFSLVLSFVLFFLFFRIVVEPGRLVVELRSSEERWAILKGEFPREGFLLRRKIRSFCFPGDAFPLGRVPSPPSYPWKKSDTKKWNDQIPYYKEREILEKILEGEP